MLRDIASDVVSFFTHKWTLIGLSSIAIFGTLLSLSHPDILPPILFFAGIWYTKLLWLLVAFSYLMFFIKQVIAFSSKASHIGFLKAFGQLLTSIPMAITLIALIILIGLIQTFVPQLAINREIDLITKFGAENYELLNSLQVFNIFSSWYLYGIVGLFLINLGACTVKRLDASIRYAKLPIRPKKPEALELMPVHKKIPASVPDAESNLVNVSKILRKKGFGVQREGNQIYAEKLRWERFSIDVFHVSLILTILALSISGFLGYNTLHVQYSGDVFSIKGGLSQTGTLQPREAFYDYFVGDFTVRVVDFGSENYEGTERVSDWTTDLQIIVNDEVVKECTIEVNKPCYYDGVGIYQAAMGEDWQFGANVTFQMFRKDFTDNAPPIFLGEHQIEVGSSLELPEENIRIHFLAFLPDFAFEANRIFTRSQSLLNPGAQLFIEYIDPSEDQENYTTWTLRNEPALQAQLDFEHMFLIGGLTAKSFTGLELSWDPGKGFAYASFSMIILTLVGHLFLNHQMIWVVYDESKNEIVIGGRCRKGSYDPIFEGLCNDIEAELEPDLQLAETGAV